MPYIFKRYWGLIVLLAAIFSIASYLNFDHGFLARTQVDTK